MRTALVSLGLLAALLAGCAAGLPQPAAATSTLAGEPLPAPTATDSPTLVAQAAGPRLALRSGASIQVIDLTSQQPIANLGLPGQVSESDLFALAPDGEWLFYAPQAGPAILFELATGGQQSLPVYTTWQTGQRLNRIAWSPNQAWVSLYTARDAGGSALWLYNLALDEMRYVADVSAAPRWSAQSGELWFQHQDGPAVLLNPETGEERPWLSLTDAQIRQALAAAGQPPDAYACVLCALPGLGYVGDYTAYVDAGQQIEYQLLDLNSQQASLVATFETQRAVPLDYNLDVSALLPLADGYLLFVHERFDGLTDNPQERFYAAWGRPPLHLVETQDGGKLPNVMPVALSPEGTQFVGFRIAEEDFIPWFASVVVVDLASGALLAEYALPPQTAGFFPPDTIFNTDLVWPLR